MPISVTVPSISPDRAPARIRIASPTRNGWASSSTRPANTLDSACCAAIPTNTLVSAPPRSSCPIGTPKSASVTSSVVTAPMRTSAYRTTAACPVPMTGSSTDRALPDSPMGGAPAEPQNAPGGGRGDDLVDHGVVPEEVLEVTVRPAGRGGGADREHERDDRLPWPGLRSHHRHLGRPVNLRPTVHQVAGKL